MRKIPEWVRGPLLELVGLFLPKCNSCGIWLWEDEVGQCYGCMVRDSRGGFEEWNVRCSGCGKEFELGDAIVAHERASRTTEKQSTHCKNCFTKIKRFDIT